jgi:hypothetical protein
MAEIVNLRQARKHKARADKARVAEQNRAAFGRGRDERERQRRLAEQAGRHLDGHRREPGDGGDR